LQGYYDYTVEFARKSLRDNPDTDIGPSLIEALQDQLGMKPTPVYYRTEAFRLNHPPG
jgi:Protein of unknown function (DUF3738)